VHAVHGLAPHAPRYREVRVSALRSMRLARHRSADDGRRVNVFATMVVDPPWPYPNGFNGWGKRRALPYASMTTREIAELPLAKLVRREGYVFLWTTNQHLGAAFDVIEAWELTYRQTITWCKAEVGGLGGMFGTNTEHVLIAQKIRRGTNAHGARTRGVRVNRSWFEWTSRGPRGEHSSKPDEFYEVVERVAPGPYVDVFARRKRRGWTCVGDAIDGRDVREAVNQLVNPT